MTRTAAAPSKNPREAAALLVAALKTKANKKTVDGMSRYGIVADKVLGVAVGDIRAIGKAAARDHGVADALWATGIYEARMLATFVDDPTALTDAQMDRWCKDFDNWAI